MFIFSFPAATIKVVLTFLKVTSHQKIRTMVKLLKTYGGQSSQFSKDQHHVSVPEVESPVLSGK